MTNEELTKKIEELAKKYPKHYKVNIERGKPEYGKVYALTGGTGTPSIMNGNTWSESEVK